MNNEFVTSAHVTAYYLILLLLALVEYGSTKSFEIPREAERYKRNVAKDGTFADGKIYYFIGDQDNAPYLRLSAEHNNTFQKAMQFLKSSTCLSFEIKTTYNARLIVDTYNSTNPCQIWNINDPESDTYLDMSNHICSSWVPFVVRLIMHGMGFAAMTNRFDAETYLNINKTNMNSSLVGEYSYFIDKIDESEFNLPIPPFEFGSILTYAPNEFSDKTRLIYTAKPPYEIYQYSMGTGRVTFADIKMINNAHCAATCSNSSTNCTNDGYPNPSNCTLCICPEGYGGPQCADLPVGSVADRTQGSILMANETWQTRFIEFGQDPNPGIRKEPMNRVDWIKASGKSRVEVLLLEVSPQCNPGCKTAGIEIKYKTKTLAGPRLCCTEHVNKTFLSALNPTPIISWNRWSYTSFWIKYRAVTYDYVFCDV